LKSIGVVVVDGRSVALSASRIQNYPTIELTDTKQPVFPGASLNEYHTVEHRIQEAERTIVMYRKQADMERANSAHKRLVNLVADRIRAAGAIPRANKFIDLAASIDGDHIFEMKSTTEHNVTNQIRKGISQLYEYRYVQAKPNASLILVIERPVPEGLQWVRHYVESDRSIHLVWDGDDRLYGSQATCDRLGFLELIVR
jgi:hypothetical protein